MDKSQDYFYIKIVNNGTDDDPFADPIYELRIISSDELVGTYNDFKYAKKQARFKFKKITKQVEKILLG